MTGRPYVSTIWILLAVGLAVSIGSAIFVRTFRKRDIRQMTAMLRWKVQNEIDTWRRNNDPVVNPRFALAGPDMGQFMTLSADKTYLVNSITNKPIFITGEIAYNLATNLSRNADIEYYLSTRQSMGFNLIWVAAVDQAYLVNPPGNALGEVPFTDYPDGHGKAFTKMNEAYFRHLDYVLQRAGARGFTVLLNPAFVGSGPTWCSDQTGWCRELQAASPADLTAYGAYLGSRYKRYPNIIWLMGGDCDLADYPIFKTKMDDIANGIRSEDPIHLMTIETLPPNGASQDGMSGSTWIDLNFLYQDAPGMAATANANYLRPDFLPTFIGEDNLENETVTDLVQRTEAYQGVLGGARLGFSFGNCVIWAFGAVYEYCRILPGQTWRNRLSSPGSIGSQNLGRLMRSREHWKLIPDINHSVLIGGYGSGDSVTVAARTSDGKTIIAYIPNGGATTLTAAMNKITSSSHSAKCWWFNPSSGAASLIGIYTNSGTKTFTPPDSRDWVLVIDDASAKLPAPGSADL
jgi:Protein of unknown function (DUF4038)/Putative collagen-binding domain of a collagenase